MVGIGGTVGVGARKDGSSTRAPGCWASAYCRACSACACCSTFARSAWALSSCRQPVTVPSTSAMHNPTRTASRHGRQDAVRRRSGTSISRCSATANSSDTAMMTPPASRSGWLLSLATT